MAFIPPPPPQWMLDGQEDERLRAERMARRVQIAAAICASFNGVPAFPDAVADAACEIEREIGERTEDEIRERRVRIAKDRAEDAKR